MHQLTIEQFTRLVANLIESLGNITLDNPSTTETFPLAVINNPLEITKYTEENIPVMKVMSITIEWWCNSKYEAMQYYERTNELLRQYNFTQGGTQIDSYDQVTQKYRYGSRYDVNYNGLTNSFERKGR